MNTLSKDKKQTYYALFIINFGITLLLMIGIFHFSAQPAPKSQQLSDGIVYYAILLFEKFIPNITFDTASFIVRKTAHATEYLLLGFFWCKTVIYWHRLQDVHRGAPTGFLKIFLSSWIIPVLYAISDEIHQSYVPGRSCELRDMCIDAFGALLGVLLAYAFQHHRALCR